MHLKKIELKGFKSFADRTSIFPVEGITCVVGPNGSGKSNITDAVRWVLGEQGAKILRGEKMEDIIFSGTGKRGSLGFAEVKLSLDNSDGALKYGFTEIEVSRRLYRSGESEYRINGSPVRLRDIRELFADTGVGLEGYSIIGQGRIDEIIGASPMDRRLLFDEASGITAYKHKKAEAERQLKSAESDLHDISIRFEETEKSLEFLAEEAKKAERCIEIGERIKDIRIHSYSKAYAEQQSALERASKKLESCENDRSAILEQKRENEAAQSAADEELSGLRQRRKSLDRERYELLGSIRNIDTEVLLNDEKCYGIEKNLRSLIQRNKSGADTISKRTEQSLALQSEVNELGDKLLELGEYISQKTAEIGGGAAKIDALKFELEAFQNKERESQKTAEDIRQRRADADRMLEQIERENAEFADFELREKQLQVMENEFEQLESVLAELRTKQLSLLEQISASEREVSEKDKDLVRTKTELAFHSENIDSYGDYEHSVQSIMKRNPDDIYGVVGELFVTKKKYEEAIETALGRNISVLVCERASTAKKYIDELRSTKGGRVSFLPLEDIRIDREFYPGDNPEGFEGMASDLIECDPKFRSVFDVLLGSILVATDFESGRRLLRYGKRVVTLRGEVFIPGGIVTGGATNRSGRILSRRRIAQECSDRVAVLDSEILAANARLAEMREQRDAVNAKLLEREALVSKSRLKLELLRSEIEKDRNNFRANLEKYEGEKKRLLAECAALDESAAEAAVEIEQVSGRILESRLEIEALTAASGIKNNELVDIKIEHARLGEQHRAKLAELERLNAEIESFESERSELASEIAALRAELENLSTAKTELVSKREELAPIAESRISGLEELEAEIARCEEQYKALAEASGNLESELRRADDRLLRSKTDFIRAESEIRRIQSELLTFFEMTAADAVAAGGGDMQPCAAPDWTASDGETPQTFDTLEAELIFLQAVASGFENVSLSSIDEYRQRQKQLEDVESEREDLMRAISATRGLIEEMSREIDSRFRQGLEKIAASFSYAFSRLFGGGEARLRLVGDGGDVLSSGVEIVVQPPGKKLRSISLLSGGEKALTAIALLFSFMEQRPSPFYILDEIEAPLDDVNLIKFTDFLREYAERAQFLVITHRRSTMEVADAIFGVTMEEFGVSKVISTKLA